MEKESLIGSRIAGGNTAYSRNKSDFYPTPPEVTQALLDFLGLRPGTKVWEPACGEGHMVDVLIKNGLAVHASDISMGIDYLTADLPSGGVDWIITNPPFSLAEQFIRRSGEHGIPFAMLVKSQYWHANKRFFLFYENKPAYILPLTWRPDFLFKTRGSGSPLMDVMWCVWIPGATKTEYRPLLKPSARRGEFDG